MLRKKKVKWYKPKVHSGWHKSQSPVYRRRLVKAKHKTYLSSARSMQALANVSKDSATKRMASADAKYFYKLHEKTGK